MADPITIADEPSGDDVEMHVGADEDDKAKAEADNMDEDGVIDNDLADLPGASGQIAAHTPFLDYLKSPIVELVVGSGASSTVLTAHSELLMKSPHFAQALAQSTGTKSRHSVALPDEDLEAVGSFIEYLYRGDYFPRSIDGRLETHPSLPDIDVDGEFLLKHARVYTLADKFGMLALKSLAHKKIHDTTSTARGEIAYARYVYESTSADDKTIRRPVAAFWATRSHVLRHEAESEFRAMCLEFPQFGFDVLSIVLDQKERRAGGGGRDSGGPGGISVGVGVETPGTGRGRKRARNI